MKINITCRLIFFVIFFIFKTSLNNASEFGKDLVKSNYQIQNPEVTKDVRFKIAGKDGNFLKYNPVNLLATYTLYIYSNLITKHYASQCMHIPTCSGYAKESIKKNGLIAGILLTADRLSRCNQIAKNDVPHIHFRNEKILDKP